LLTIRSVCGVPEERHGGAALEGGVAALVELHDEGRAGHRVDAALVEGEPPAPLVADRVDHAQRDGVLEPEQRADDHRAVRPRAGQADVEDVAAGLHRVAAAAVGRHAVGEVVRLALERAALDLGELPGHDDIPREKVASRSCRL
jgi:hypothetical protein